jgi:hypothetical protein
MGDYAFGFLTLGARGTLYSTSGHNVQVVPVGTHGLVFNNRLKLGALTEGGLQLRGVPWGQAGVSTIVERVFDTNWRSLEKLKHTIEPFVTYTYVPPISQSSLPLFDEVDRVRPRSLITYGATTRLYGRLGVLDRFARSQPIEPPNANGLEQPVEPRADATADDERGDVALALAPKGSRTISRGSEVRELVRLTLLSAYDTNHPIGPDGSRVGDIQGTATIFPTSILWAGAQLNYNPRADGGITNASFFINVQPPWELERRRTLYMGKALQGSFLQLSYNFVDRESAVAEGTKRNASQFMTARMYTDIFDRLGVYVAPSYDFAAQQLLQAEYGVRLKSPCDCWAFDIGIVDSFNPKEVQFQFQLTLGGLGSIGQSPFGRSPFQTLGLVGAPTGVLPRY